MEISRKSKHKSSILLSFEENNVIFGKLAKGETALSTAVAQLVLSCPPDHTRWELFNTGVMIFVKSNRSRTYYFRLYDLKEPEKLWEQEIYLNIIYSAVEPRFHTFEAEDCMAGLNFADQTEANDFLFVVNQKIKLLSEMFGLKEKVFIENNTNINTNIISNTKSNSLNVPEVTLNKSISLESLNTKKRRFKLKKKSSKKLTKEEKKLEIGLPTNFKHIQHIGWSPSTGFEFNVIDQKLNNFFSLAGVSENQLQDSETRKFIFDFISSNGGIETAIQESVQPIEVKVN